VSDVKEVLMRFAEKVRDLTRDYEFHHAEPDPSVALPFVVEKAAYVAMEELRATTPTEATP